MADEQHLWLLRRSVSAWDEWRSRTPDLIPNLRRADLRGANLLQANLSGANLSDADLSQANLRKADLQRAILLRAHMRGANLSGADMSMANLLAADLSQSKLMKADLRAANLIGADLSNADLSDADLRDADLIGADLSGANIRGTNFQGANLSGCRQPPAALSYRRNYAPSNKGGLEETNTDYENAEFHFSVVFAPELSKEQIQTALNALADFYRACGGVGLKVDFDLATTPVGVPEYVER